MIRFSIFSLVSGILLYAVSCIQFTAGNQGGGGSEVEVVGQVCHFNGEPASLTQVKLIPVEYDPSATAPIPDSMIDTTDAQGYYFFHNVAPNKYNLQALQLVRRTRMLITGVEVTGDSTVVLLDTLLASGTIRISLSGVSEGCVSIPGTDITVLVPMGSSEIIIDSVPTGNIPEIRYYVDKKTVGAIRQNVLVKPDETTVLTNILWKFSQRIVLNTSASGAEITTDVYNFPVLIRLSDNNFDFSQAASRGEDMCFTTSYGKSLPFEIEHWDAISRNASIWVKVDTVYSNDTSQSIIMYWGNSSAEELSNSETVFDTADGFQGVWHLGDTNDVRDATVNKYHGLSPDTARPSNGHGLIGNCSKFNGIADYIIMPNTADSKLSFEESSYYTISAWALLDTFDNSSHCIVSKGYEQYYLRLTYFPTNIPLWEFVEFGKSINWQASTSPASKGQWVLLTGVRQGSKQFLYCNGILVDSTTDNWTQGFSRSTDNDISVGRFLKEVTFPTNDGFCFFKGSIDEVRICNQAKGADFIMLCYMNQRIDDRLVKFIH